MKQWCKELAQNLNNRRNEFFYKISAYKVRPIVVYEIDNKPFYVWTVLILQYKAW